MSRSQFWGLFAVLLVLFLVVEGPIWAHPWDLSAVNRAILLSYAPIPLLVVGCLLWSHRLRWVSFFLDTLSLTLLKYSVTFAFALFMWGVLSRAGSGRAGSALGASSLRGGADARVDHSRREEGSDPRCRHRGRWASRGGGERVRREGARGSRSSRRAPRPSRCSTTVRGSSLAWRSPRWVSTSRRTPPTVSFTPSSPFRMTRRGRRSSSP